MTPAIQVLARDASGNVATGFTGTVTIGLGANPVGGTLAGPVAVAANAGLAVFPGLSVAKSGDGYRLSAGATGLTSALSTVFNVTPGPATQLAFLAQPVNSVAGATIAPPVQVRALDAQGNTATGFSGNITAAIGANPNGGVLGGTATVAATAGVASFGTLSINAAGVGYTLTAAAAGLVNVTSAAFDITSGTAAQLVFTVQPTSATAGVANAAVQVTARDAQGNTATGFTGNVTITIGTNPGGSTLTGGGPVAAVAGVATFPNLRLNRTGTGYTLTAAAAGQTNATSAAFNITPAPASALFVTAQPSNATAGVANAPAVQVTARDSVGNTATSFTSNVTIAIGTNPGGSTLTGGGPIAAVSGVATFANLRLNRTGTGYTLTAAATGVTGATSSTFNIAPAPASALVVTVQPTATTAGTAIAPPVVVTARDSVGNTATSFAGNVTMAIGTNPGASTLTGDPVVAAVAGVATFANLRLNRPGTGYTLNATATSVTGTTTAAFNVAAAPVSALVFTVQPAATTTAGVAIAPSVQVTARDSVGNTATSFAGNITIAIGTNPGASTLTGAPVVAAVAGVATFANLRLNRAGVGYTLTAAATGAPTATSAAFNIAAAPASVLVVTVQPATTTAGVAIAPPVQVTARDSVGNTATSFTGNVTMAIGTNPGGSTLTGTPVVAAVAGVATFANLRLDRTGTGYALAAAATGLTGATSSTFNIVPAPASLLVFTVQPTSATAGVAIAPAIQITARDSVGNVATSFAGTVVLNFGANPGGSTLGGTTIVGATAGVASFGSISVNRTGTGYTLVAASTGVTSATSTAFNVTPGTATQLAFTVQPTTTVAAASVAPAIQVTARDAFGNTATSFTGNVSLTIGVNPGSGTLTGGDPVAAVAGVATFASVSINKTGAGYQLTANAGGLIGAASAPFAITPAAPTLLTFTVQPSDETAGDAFTPAVRVTAFDAQGNLATQFTGNVTMAIGVNPGGGTLSGSLTAAAVAGVATFTDLRINRIGSDYRLTAAATGLTGATSAPFNIALGPATQLAFTVQPTDQQADVPIAPTVRVDVQDAQGNRAWPYVGTITLTLVNPNGAILIGGGPLNVNDGFATFPALRVDKAGTYTLQAESSGLPGTVSATFTITGGVSLQ